MQEVQQIYPLLSLSQLNKFLTLLILFSAILSTKAQDCTHFIEGLVFDKGTQLPLSDVNIYIKETSEGCCTDERGLYSLYNLCKGEYHIVYSHIGCEPKQIHLDLKGDTVLNIDLAHTINTLGTIHLDEDKTGHVTQPTVSINKKTIENNLTKNLGGIIENQTGVSLLRTGSSIAKPIVHGLFGNRLTIINNGIVQGGQQWGKDHGPEIDPFSSNKITIIKGVNAISSGGGNLGSVIIMESDKISSDPHLHGHMNYAYETNGKGNNLNIQLEKGSEKLAWRVNGTLKQYGDKNTPDYFLKNTGIEEANFSIQLQKNWNEKLYTNFYASTFNTKLGVLRGSHIGNLTDLEEALTREVPFFTEEDFSRDISAPMQKVAHHLAKIDATYLLSDHQKLEFVIAAQQNNRREFDIRRGDRTDLPMLSLLQNTFSSDIRYISEPENTWAISIGNQNIITDNTNDPETKTSPLIPDYLSFKSGLFAIASKKKNALDINLGLRYDMEYQNIVAIERTVPRTIKRYTNNFHNISGVSSFKFNLKKNQSILFSSGLATRNPGINELFSKGVHHGVSAIEDGDVNLKTEKAFKNTLEYNWAPSSKFKLNALVYHQNFENYIFLKPQDEMKLTIRGAFPYFKYEQTDAYIYGFDLSSEVKIINALQGVVRYSFLRGKDVSNNEPLISLPSNNLHGSIKYQVNRSFNVSQNIRAEELEISMDNKTVFKQTNLLDSQDYAPAPETYNLFGLKISSRLVLPKHYVNCYIRIENLFDVAYREYLNRHRYFADDIGRSITFGMNFKF